MNLSFSGESWIGLDNLHRLTSQRSYSLKLTMTDYDGTDYVAVFENFKVNSVYPNPRNWNIIFIWLT